MVYIISFIIWIVLCALVAAWAEKKGHKGVGYLFLSIFLSPLLGFIIVACISDRTVKECPYCKKMIDLNATNCSYCGKDLTHKSSQTKTDSDTKELWVSQRIIELISSGIVASDAKIQAEAEYSVKQMKKENN